MPDSILSDNAKTIVVQTLHHRNDVKCKAGAVAICYPRPATSEAIYIGNRYVATCLYSQSLPVLLAFFKNDPPAIVQIQYDPKNHKQYDIGGALTDQFAALFFNQIRRIF